MRKLFLILVFFIPLSFGLAHEDESSVLIAITSEGFKPSTLSISPHTKVVFINRDSVGHWPASDRHPSHSDYGGTSLETHCDEAYGGPEPFDSCQALESGETWSFIFEESGTFHYHDHVWSHLGGTITVIDGRQKLRIEIWIASFVEWVRSLFIFDIEKFESELVSIVESSDPRLAIEALQQESQKRPKVSEVCHDLIHEIGRSSFKKYGNLEQTFSYQSDFCNSGYIHGVFEEYFVSNEISENELSSLCQNTSRPFDAWQCHHGLGHGLMYKNGGDITKVLEACSRSLDEKSASQCHNGAYMELFNNEVLLNEPSFINTENPLDSCSRMTIKQSDCYLYAPTYFTQNLNWSHEEALTECKKLEGPSKLSCINGAAAEAAKRNQSDLKKVFMMCEEFESFSEDLNACVRGASGITVFQTASIEAATLACNDAYNYTERCRSIVKDYKPLFAPTY